VTQSGTANGVPLARLFAIAYRQLIDSLHENLRSQGWTDVRPAFGFVLLAARDGPTTSTELGALMGTTKQAASKLVDTMEATGYLRRATGAEDGRRRPIHLTPRGERLLATVEEIYAELEAQWADVIGASNVERLRRDLARAVSIDHRGQLPAIRPTL
jgi:DNA-binding MarR family transcriptional regulator